MKITMVKKVMGDGSPCEKCEEIVRRLEARGVMGRIDRVLGVMPRHPDSEGMRLAKLHNVKQAPFFVVERDDGGVAVYDSFLRFLREVFPEASGPEA